MFAAPFSPLAPFARPHFHAVASASYLNSLAWIHKIIVHNNVFSDAAMTSPVSTNGATVSYIRDTSASANHCFPGSTANLADARPTLITNATGGKSAITCPALNQHLLHNPVSIPAGGSFTRISVVSSPGSATRMWAGSSTSTAIKEGRNANNYFIRAPTSAYQSTWPFAANVYGLIVMTRNGAFTQSNNAVRFNGGATITSGNVGDTTAVSWNVLGSAGDTNAQTWNGGLAASLVIDRILTDTEIAGVSAELNALFSLY